MISAKGLIEDASSRVTYNPMPKFTHENNGPFTESDLITTEDGKMYHLHLTPEQVADNIIIVGDPDRVTTLAEKLFLEELEKKLIDSINVECEVVHRGLRTITGVVKGTEEDGGLRVTILTSGMGHGSTSIVVNELIDLREIDLETKTRRGSWQPINLIRIGTCGALQDDTVLGTPIVASHCIGMHNGNCFSEIPPPSPKAEALERKLEGVILDTMSPKSFHYGRIHPIVSKSSSELVAKFHLASKSLGIKVEVGIVAENSNFDHAQGRDVFRVKPSIPNIDRVLAGVESGIAKQRIIAMEMEGHTVTSLNAHDHRAAMVVVPVAQRAEDKTIDPIAFANGVDNCSRLVLDVFRRLDPSKPVSPYRPEDSEMSFSEAVARTVLDNGYRLPDYILEKALRVAIGQHSNAHTPYVDLPKRGVAVICKSEEGFEIFGGTDVQSAAYPSSLDGVKSAIRAARLAGLENKIAGVMVYSDADEAPLIYDTELGYLKAFADEIPLVRVSLSGDVEVDYLKVPKHIKERIGSLTRHQEYQNPAITHFTDLPIKSLHEYLSSKFGLKIELQSFIRALEQAALASTKGLQSLSNYQVGAALLLKSGDVVSGSNIEMVPLSETLCAERVALERAGAEGFLAGRGSFSELVDLTVTYVPQSNPAEPCGACRQALTEITASRPILAYCKTAEVMFAEGLSEGKVVRAKFDGTNFQLKEITPQGGLLAASFGAKNLA